MTAVCLHLLHPGVAATVPGVIQAEEFNVYCEKERSASLHMFYVIFIQ